MSLSFDDFARLAVMCENDFGFYSPVTSNMLRTEVSKLNDEVKQFRTVMSDTKDRVDISLHEYEELKRINKDLLNRLNHAERILGMLNIPADMIQNIDPDSVEMYSTEGFDPKNIFVRKRRFRIEFDVEE